MWGIGIATLFFRDDIRALVLKVIGQKRKFVNLINSAQTTWSMRFGGVIAIVVGFFVLWMSWRNP